MKRLIERLLGRAKAGQIQDSNQNKLTLAAEFFSRLGKGSAGFIRWMMNEEMDPALVQFLIEMGRRMNRGTMDQGQFHGSLLVLGYLVRSYEDRARAGKEL